MASKVTLQLSPKEKQASIGLDLELDRLIQRNDNS
jgi:hypothetical protein